MSNKTRYKFGTYTTDNPADLDSWLNLQFDGSGYNGRSVEIVYQGTVLAQVPKDRNCPSYSKVIHTVTVKVTFKKVPDLPPKFNW